MVDRIARDKYAELLRHFCAGRMTLEQYEDRSDQIAAETADHGLRSVIEDFWDIDPEFDRATAPHRPSREAMRFVAGIVLFLQSDLEYEWPDSVDMDLWLTPLLFLIGIVLVSASVFFFQPARLAWLGYGLIGLGLTVYLFRNWWLMPRRWKSAGDRDAWPFLHHADLEEARRHPRLLAGR